MKKIILMIVVLLGIFIPTKIYALEDSFYEGEYIPNAYIKKIKDNTGKYEQMRVFRRNGDNRVVYCLELWNKMNSNKSIVGYDINQANHLGIDNYKWQRISLLAYYGYGYNNHNDLKWYAITQFMIWETLEENSTIYFTDTLNGNRVDLYTKEIDELNNLVNRHSLTPNVATNITANRGNKMIIYDHSNAIQEYDIIPSEGVVIHERVDNRFTFSTSIPGKSTIRLVKKAKLYSNSPTVYIDNNGQNLLLPGYFTPIERIINITIPITDVIINKLDLETKSSISQGEASLAGTEFKIYDYNNNYVGTEVVDENSQIVLKNIGYGIYHLEETKPGKGYLINNDKIFITVNQSSNSFNIYNKVITNQIKINKYLKNNDGTIEPEEATFEIFNKNKEKIMTFTTESGSHELVLPYGTYLVKQITGKNNYQMVDDFNISVIEEGVIQELDLYDAEIKKEIEEVGDITEPVLEIEPKEIIYDIPNTYQNSNSFNILNLFFIMGIILLNKGKTNEEN